MGGVPKEKMNCNIESTSFKDDFYDNFFFNLVKERKPKCIVNLGIYKGHATYCMATALEDNGFGILEGWDLWEQYPFTHCTMEEAIANLDGLPVILRQQDAFDAYQYYPPDYVDILFVDISNTGETYKRILEDWHLILKKGGLIIFEGGSEERDQVEWMTKFNMPPIHPVVHCNNEWITDKYSYVTITRFPSITIFEKK